MATNNVTILHDIWLSGTNDFQQRVPEPTQTNIQKVAQTLFDPMNQMYFNQFMDALIMRIGTSYTHQQAFQNPLREFKKAQLTYGNTVQEIIPKWIRAHSYVDDAEDVFKMARPDARVWYHSQNRRDRYDITVNDIELRTAFTDSEGLNRLVASIMRVPINADEYDEYTIMMQLIAQYENTWGFFKHGLSAAPTDESTGKEFLTALRTYAGLLRFPSTTYNNGALPDVPIFVNPSELVLLVTPQTQAALDVQTLSGIFQLEKADIQYRTILVREFPLPNNDCVALLTTRDFFMVCDTVYQNTSMYNPKTLGTNYFLHHWGVYSVSPFVPAIMFKVGASSSPTVVTQTVSGLSMSPNNGNVDPGENKALTLTLSGSISPTNPAIKVAPSSATYDVSVIRGATEGTAGVYVITFTGTWAQNDTVKVNDTTATISAESPSTSDVATAVATAMASDTTYTVVASSNKVTLTEKSGKYGTGAPTVTKTSTSGVATRTTTTAGVAPSDGAPLNSPMTRVDEYGILHVSRALQSGDEITVIATSTYVNPSGSTNEYTATGTFTVQ